MKRSLALIAAAWAALVVTFGCAHVDLRPESDPDRVITGTVNVRMDLIPPPDAEVVVRVVVPPDVSAAPAAAGKDLVLGERGTTTNPERVIGEHVIRTPASMPVPFRVEFHASEAQLRHGLNIEARISWGGRVRFRNVESQVVTLETVANPHAIWVEPVR